MAVPAAPISTTDPLPSSPFKGESDGVCRPRSIALVSSESDKLSGSKVLPLNALMTKARPEMLLLAGNTIRPRNKRPGLIFNDDCCAILLSSLFTFQQIMAQSYEKVWKVQKKVLPLQRDYEKSPKKERDVAQLVAHTSGGREVASSSLVIPTLEGADSLAINKGSFSLY